MKIYSFRLRQWLILSTCTIAMSAANAGQLIDLFHLALDKDPTLAGTRAALEAAQQAEPIARGALLPQAVGQGKYTVQQARTQQRFGPLNVTDNGRTTTYELTLGINQVIYDPVKYLQVDRAVGQADAAELRVADVLQNLTFRLAENYFNVLAARDATRALEAEGNALARQTDSAQRRFELGYATITDLREAKARVDLTKASLVSSRASIAAGQRSLTEITGDSLTLENMPTLRESLPLVSPNPSDPDLWVASAQFNSPAVLLARKTLDLARTDLQIAQARHKPTLTAGFLGSDTEDKTNTSIQSSRGVGLQLNAYVPLYLGGVLIAGESSAAATAVQREAELEGALRAAERQARDAYAQVGTDIARVQAYQAALSSARLAVDASQISVRLGVRTSVDLLNAQRDFYNTRRNYDRARYDYLLSVLRLKASAGRLDGSAIAEVDRLLDGNSISTLDLPNPSEKIEGLLHGQIFFGQLPKASSVAPQAETASERKLKKKGTGHDLVAAVMRQTNQPLRNAHPIPLRLRYSTEILFSNR